MSDPKKKKKKGDFRIVNLMGKTGAFLSTETKEGTMLLDIRGNKYMQDKVPPDPHSGGGGMPFGFRIVPGRDYVLAGLQPQFRDKQIESLKAKGKLPYKAKPPEKPPPKIPVVIAPPDLVPRRRSRSMFQYATVETEPLPERSRSRG
jgi:hypothetical protein